ncbi:MAG: hypothetical protein WKF40_11870 [Thermoleophilaceae bacterium]
MTNSSVMATMQTRKVSRMSPGRLPPVWESTRGWVKDSAMRTAAKLIGTNAPAAIANTDE